MTTAPDAPRGCAIGLPMSPLRRDALLGVTVVTAIFSVLFGWSWPFLNRSTEHAIYTSRLIRAYLGASNPERLSVSDRNVTEAIAGDDIPQEVYWSRFSFLKSCKKPIGSAPAAPPTSTGPSPDDDRFYRLGMPLHLVNVTVNETIDTASQIEQQDRKGLGMAIGPAGLSAGIRHHLVLTSKDLVEARPPAAPEVHRVFNFGKQQRHPELLTLGNWTGISGAAFSTSLGWRTSLSLSLLAGLANVRLGYWWNSATEVVTYRNYIRRGASWLFQNVFKVQNFLFDEFLARFHGTARRYWLLSDGGHFENMGGYELIRRRLRRIIIIDAEADPDYTFEGLSNLVRKARLDFQTEIRFLDQAQLQDKVHTHFRKYFGSLEQLRRGVWSKEPVKDPVRERARLSVASDDDSLSLAHAALAQVKYPDGNEGWLLYLKPTLIGDEPADVRRYHTEHPSFPHETTAEQFFDEAQWESYRRLGEHIADRIFPPLAKELEESDPNSTPARGTFAPYSWMSA